MGKLSPKERWRRHVIESLTALKHSGELQRLSAEGLAILGREKLYTGEEWWRDFSKRAYSPEYQAWHEDCRKVGERFGIARWVVVMLSLVRGYSPEEEPHVIEAEWPRIWVVTESGDSLFLQWLCYQARQLGLYVIQRLGSSEATLLYLDGAPPAAKLSASGRPPRDAAFHLRVETPVRYPPEGASQLQKEATRLGGELLRRLGYSVPRRLRASPLVQMAETLRADQSPLEPGQIYHIVDDLYGEGDLSRDRQRRNMVKSGRHRVRKRLVEPYLQESGDTLQPPSA